VTLSYDLVRLLTASPVEDAWEPVFPLLTVDPDGYPRVCLLSRAELTAGPDTVRCVLRSPHTIANLRGHRRAVLIVVSDRSARYLRLRVLEVVGDESAAGVVVRFSVLEVKDDTLDIPLRPMTFWSSAYVRGAERWEENRVLLDRPPAARPADGGRASGHGETIG